VEQICLDTSSLIDIINKGKYFKFLEENKNAYISIITSFEFLLGRVNEDHKKIVKEFNTLNLNYNIISLAADIYKRLKDKGEMIGTNDILIASTCIENKIPLLTINLKHFKKLEEFGLNVITN